MTPLEERVITAVSRLVVDHVNARDAGHCIQIGNLPPAVAEAACKTAYAALEPGGDFARFVAERPTAPWHATPTKIVELRNHVDEKNSRLAVFVAAGDSLAVEDSIGESTFEVMQITDLYRTIAEELRTELAEKNEDLAERTEEVLSIVQADDRFGAGDEAVAAFLSRLVATPTQEELGWALTELELLPDATMRDLQTPDFKSRLIRNSQQMTLLVDPTAPVERIRRLPLDSRKEMNRSILGALGTAIADGTLDSGELARRFDEPSLREQIDFANWEIGAVGSVPEEFRVLQLVGDLTGDAEPTVTKALASVGVKYRCRPAPERIDGLTSLSLEAVRVGERDGELFETGYEANKRSALPRQIDAQWKIKIDTDGLDERDALFCFRLRAWNEDNALVSEALSPVFRIGDELPENEPDVTAAPSIAAARVIARGESSEIDSSSLRKPTLTLESRTAGDEARKVASLVVRFGQASVASRLRISRILAMLERETLADPEQLGRYEINLGQTEISNVVAATGVISETFLQHRSSVFELVRHNQLELADDDAPHPLVALAELPQLLNEIEAYVRAWVEALEETREPEILTTLLAVDQVAVLDRGHEIGRLVGPTHPLRLLWLARYQQLLEDWVWNAEADPREARELAHILETLHPANLPHVLVTEQRRTLRAIQPVDLYWSIYGTPSSADSTALAARVRGWLRMEETATATVSVDDVVQRIRRYLIAHPYADFLVLNFVQPGLSHIVLETLLRLQDDPTTEHLRYTVRLFSRELSRNELGRALDDFMADPDASRTARKQAADAFLASSEDPLAPKLTYSKHDLEELLGEPEKYPAHLTLFLDSFDLEVVVAAPIDDRRSFFGSNLIIEPAVVYRPADEALDPQWDEHIVADPASADLLVSAYGHSELATARSLGAPEGTLVPVVRLQLDRIRRAVLDAVHRSSDWIVVIDPVFTDEYLDTPPAADESPRFLIDYAAPTSLETGRRVVVSTRSRAELRSLLQPVMAEHDLELAEDRVDALLDGLQLLGSGLGLKLLNNRTQALEAFSLALGSLHLAEHGVLRHAIAIPLDLHQDLFREGQRQDPDEVASLSRTDLAVVQIDPEKRHFGVHLVELKARRTDANGADLLETVKVQLENSRKVLRSRLFGADLRDRPGSLAAALQVRRLSKLLSRYLERAARYGLVSIEMLEPTRRFLTELDSSYSVGFEKHALIFDLGGESKAAERIGDVRVVRIGRDEVRDILARVRTPLETVIVGRGETLQTVFGAVDARAERVLGLGQPGEAAEPDGPPEPGTMEEGILNREHEPEAPDAGEVDGPLPESVEIIGTAPTTAQFGIVGKLASSGTAVAMDLDGTNVVSVFGVQGSGKSYTVGTLLEAALLKEPKLNRLPRPLGGIVFHYTTDLTYVPEFAAMGLPNADMQANDRLLEEYGATPGAIEDIVVLVPEALLVERRADFPELRVEPLVLGPSELNLNDWRLLMGLDGGEQMYARSMNNVFRKLRGDVSVESLRDAVEDSAMTKNQKTLASTRIEFAESFVKDGAGVAHHVRPGRLVIVDIRDELIEQDEALAVFMVLLNRFGQVSEEKTPFNKIIVFDEAHKYMGNTRLTQAIVDNIRLMRHRGTTVVIASQDPPSVPKEVVELSSVIIAHRFTSPKWLDHVRKVNSAFGEAAMQPSHLARLAPGEAFVWSVGGAEQFRRPQRILLRPRVTQHGGATRRAT